MSNKSNGRDGFDRFADILYNFIQNVFTICFYGLKKVSLKNLKTWALLFSVMALLASLLLLEKNYLYEITKVVFFGTPPVLIQLLFKMSVGLQYGLALFFFVAIALVRLGYKDFKLFSKYQKAIERAGLRSATSEVPKIKSIIMTGEYRSRVTVETFGVGINKFESSKDSLTASFRQTVESIVLNDDKGLVDIHLCERDLPQLVGFHELFCKAKEPYSFVIGQSLKGPVVQPIRTLPHLLISGATGGGKSVFFRSTMLSLLKSSPHIQLYLLDLKRGVEVKEFAALPNVKTAKDEHEATSILGSLVDEMNRRYKFLEEKGFKSIDPKRDEMDLIVVGIDEAAALFGKKSNKEARQYIDELARLARAAGIHLIPSTQKPVKEAIDTGTLDNIPGRMTFRMVSSAASNVAMGGNFAKKLPAIKGRAIWSNGSEHVEVQAPYVDDEMMNVELEIIKQEFDEEIRKNFQELLDPSPKHNINIVKTKADES